MSDEEVEERIEAALAQNFPAGAGATPPQVTEDMRSQARRAMHTERTLERLAAIVKGEAPELPEGEQAADDEGAEAAQAEADGEGGEPAVAENAASDAEGTEGGDDGAEADKTPAQ